MCQEYRVVVSLRREICPNIKVLWVTEAMDALYHLKH